MQRLILPTTLWMTLLVAPLPLAAGGLESGARALRAALPPDLTGEGLVILKHREGAAFDLADFLANPERYREDFAPLTRAQDEDDWTVREGKGQIVTRLDHEDLFIVAAGPGLALDVEWGDLPLAAFFERRLAIQPDAEGCYSSLGTQLRDRDGRAVQVPHRLFFCPTEAAVLFDAPDGYEIGLSALRGEERVERTEASTSVSDNLRLYVREVNPRSSLRRSTGSIGSNTLAGFSDAGRDLRDLFGHAVTGTYSRSIHTGQERYRPSPLTAGPLFLWHLFHLRPGEGLAALFAGPASGVQVAADAVSASSNAVLNPFVQVSIGSVSPHAADLTTDSIGTVLQVAAKNLPLAERAIDSWSPLTFVQHDRAFQPGTYTRTDTQLNIDRTAAVLDLHVIQRIRAHQRDNSRRRNNAQDDGSPEGATEGPPDGSGDLPGGGGSDAPPTGGGDVPPAGGGDVPPVGGGDVPPVGGGDVPPVGGGDVPPIGGGDAPPVGGGDVPPVGGGDVPPIGGGGSGSGGGGTPGGGPSCTPRGGAHGGGNGNSNASGNAVDVLADKFCGHPVLNGLLPVR